MSASKEHKEHHYACRMGRDETMRVTREARTLTAAVTAGAAALLGLTVLAGCSSASEESTSTETSSEESAQLLPPVIVEPGQTEAAAKVGDFIDIVVDDPVATSISTADTGIVEISQGYDDGSAIFNPGARALSPGTATITITMSDGSSYDLVVTVSE